MGLDILIAADNYEQLQAAENNRYQHSLSRTFCDLMCRRHATSHEPELEQIGRITDIDISPIYDMEDYPEEENLEFLLESAGSEDAKQKILKETEVQKAKLQGNIHLVLKTITALIDKLNLIDNLANLLDQTDLDSLGRDYFADFHFDKGDGYIGNNFGQDLRNFKRFLDFAKANGTTTVWFNYG